MGLLERVGTLVRANLNDLIDRAENPEVMLKQVILDMQNQLMQVKTQVAVAVADQHVLEKKLKENGEAEAEWIHKAEVAVGKGRDDLARAAVERVLSHREMGSAFREQLEAQRVQVENLKSALRKLEQKLNEAQSRSELLAAQHRRARALQKATDAKSAMTDPINGATFDRMKDKVRHEEALSEAKAELAADDFHDKLLALEREDKVDALLLETKARRGTAA
jgi:phage shock protein A